MTVFQAGGKARTSTFKRVTWGTSRCRVPPTLRAGGRKICYFSKSSPLGPHDILAAEWLAHTPAHRVNQHLYTGEEFVDKIAKKESVITPT